jgi:hypothetical protein
MSCRLFSSRDPALAGESQRDSRRLASRCFRGINEPPPPSRSTNSPPGTAIRKTDSDKAISELPASIAAHGLLQSLVLRKDMGGKYAVIAGPSRLLALGSLAKNGDSGPSQSNMGPAGQQADSNSENLPKLK